MSQVRSRLVEYLSGYLGDVMIPLGEHTHSTHLVKQQSPPSKLQYAWFKSSLQIWFPTCPSATPILIFRALPSSSVSDFEG